MRSTGKRLSSTRSSRRHGTASSSNRPYCQSTIRIQLPPLGQPRIRSYVFEADMYAADVLRNDKIKLQLLKHLDRNIHVVPSYFLITRPI